MYKPMAYRNRRRRPNRRPSKARKARTALKRSSPKLYRAVKAIAKTQALAVQETKYITTYSNGTIPANTQAWNGLITTVALGNYQYLQTAMPAMSQGANSSTIIGQKIRLVNGYTKFHFSFITSTVDNYNQDIILRLFMLNSKNVKNLQSSLNGLPGKNLLRTGQSTQCDFNPQTAITTDPNLLAMLPLNTLNWSGRSVTFRFTKNAGSTSYNPSLDPEPVGDVPNLASRTNYHDYTWNWTDGKKNAVLDYGNAFITPDYPTNYCPLWGVVAYYPNGNPVNVDSNVQFPISVTWSSHMWFKDA